MKGIKEFATGAESAAMLQKFIFHEYQAAQAG
jgi:hypothetical protein